MLQLSKKGRLLKETKLLSQKDTCTHKLTTTLSTIAKTQDLRPLIDEWIKKFRYICKYNGILFSHKTRKFYHL